MKSADPQPCLKIGDVARLVGVSPSAIRSWEKLGLTRPRRTASKYRLYTGADVKLLKRARFLRQVRGLNAPAIVQMLKQAGLVRPASNGAANAIGIRLRQLRKNRKLSLARVAKAAGISRAEVLRRGLRSYGAEQLRGKGPVLELMRSQQLEGAPRDLGELHDEHLAREYRGE